MDLQEQIDIYLTGEAEGFEAYAEFLKLFLSRNCSLIAPLAIVKARAKDPASFAEKCVRKQDKYEDPVYQLGDLCGGRIITPSQAEADDVCEFIRTYFDITEEENVLERLDIGEFSYRSVHFLVELPLLPTKLTSAGEVTLIPEEQALYDTAYKAVDRENKPRKRIAEIQVRTLLQHAWADIVHDRLYKTKMRLPREYRREAARLAAILESADDAFGKLVEKIDAFEVNYGAYMNREEMDAEIATLKQLLSSKDVGPKRPDLALRVALIAKATGDWDTVIETLIPYETNALEHVDAIHLELGNALCHKHGENTRSAEFKHGEGLIRSISDAKILQGGKKRQARTRARALSLLGWICEHDRKRGWSNEALKYYYQAYTTDPCNPYHFKEYLETQVRTSRKNAFTAHLQPVIDTAIGTCREHIKAGIELPFAWFTIGEFFLLRVADSREARERYFNECIAAYIRGIKSSQVLYPLSEELESIRDLSAELSGAAEISDISELLQTFLSVERLLTSGIAAKRYELAKRNDPVITDADSEGNVRVTDNIQFKHTCLIIAGSARTDVTEEINNRYRDILDAALAEFEGTVISGGTVSGVPGLVGQIAEEQKSRNLKKYDLISYLPENLPADAPRDERYDSFIVEPGTHGFSISQPLQNWIDILASGIDPRQVRLIGIGGGAIALLEYELASAFGADIGLIEGSGGAVDKIVKQEQWWNDGQVVLLPCDRWTLAAFVSTSAKDWERNDLESAAKFIHDEYRKDRSPSDENLKVWEKLKPTYKNSCFHQAAYAEQNLRSVGLEVVKADPGREIAIADLSKLLSQEQIEELSRREHGRWNVERLRQGWTNGKERDDAKRVHTCIIPWEQLDEKTKQYDRDAVMKYPETLKQAGFEVRKPACI